MNGLRSSKLMSFIIALLPRKKVGNKRCRILEQGGRKETRQRTNGLSPLDSGSAAVCPETRLQSFVPIPAVGCSDLSWLILGPPPPPMLVWQRANVVVLLGMKLVPKLIFGS